MSNITTVCTPRSATFQAALDGLRAQAAALGGPVLLGPVSGLAGLRDGQAFADTLDQRGWEFLYGELRQAAPETAALPSLEALHDRAQPDGQGITPIALVCHSYRKPGPRLTRALMKAGRDDAGIALPDGALEDLFETRTAFAASAILPPAHWGFERLADRHAGLTVRFRLASDFCIADGERPQAIEADFDDGQGFRPIGWDQVETVDYDEAGERRIRLRAQTAGGERTAAFQFFAEAGPADTDTAGWRDNVRITAKIPYEGRCYDGIAYVYYANNNHDRRVKRPFLLAEGFPGGNDPNLIYDYFNGRTADGWNPDSDLADSLRMRGYDVIILIFSTKGAAIQANAFVYLRALEFFWGATQNPNATIVAAGGSMGGLIARYALAYGEHHKEPMGKVARLITFDSPHCGANLPLSVQFTVRYFDKRAETSLTLLNYPCSRQMLSQQVWQREGTEPVAKKTFTDFYEDLEKLANGGYPRNIERFAVCNGAHDGTPLITPACTHALTVWRSHWPGPNYQAILYTTPNGRLDGRVAIADSWITDYTYRSVLHLEPTPFFPNRDSAPGGFAKFFEQARDSLNPTCASAGVRMDQPRSCFIPAHSALGVKVQDAYSFKPSQLRDGETPFTGWLATTTNTAHCTVNKAIRDWVLLRHPLQLPEAESLEPAE